VALLTREPVAGLLADVLESAHDGSHHCEFDTGRAAGPPLMKLESGGMRFRFFALHG
jgi:hypothetical protein